MYLYFLPDLNFKLSQNQAPRTSGLPDLLFPYLCAHLMKQIQELYPLLATPRKVVITTHQKPDADAMGSSLALYHFLNQFGHDITVISPTNWAGWLNWMPGVDTVVDYELNKEKTAGLLAEAEWLFCLDFNIFHRTKNLAPLLAAATCTKILIDHHQEPDSVNFQYGISDTS